jgi:hypothetical protein
MRVADAPVPHELEAHHAMWFAALALLIADARAYLAKPLDRVTHEERTAYRDLTTCGPMTRRLGRYCLVDAQEISRQFLASMGQREAA